MTITTIKLPKRYNAIAERRARNSAKGKLNRTNGYKFEWLIMKDQAKQCTYIGHTQKGLWDLIAFGKDATIKMISCKINGYHTPAELREIKKFKASMPSNVSCYMASATNGKKIHYVSL